MRQPLLVCLMGAECTGKTTLAQTLARHFSGCWVPEHLRAFCDLHGRTPRVDEQALIMRAQFEQEEQVTNVASMAGCELVFCDTSPLLTAIYSDYYFHDTGLYVSARALHGRYALNLVLAPDVTWVPDGRQRDGEPARTAVHTRVLHELQTMRFPHIEISGTGKNRLQAAILAVETLTS